MTAGDADELVHEGEVHFAKPLARALLREARLSWAARGLFAFLWDLPRGWRPRLAHLVGMGPDGRDAVRARLRELEALGALRIEPIRGEGGRVAGKRWVLVAPERWATMAPLRESEKTEDRKIRPSVEPTVGETDAKVRPLKVPPPEGSPTPQPPRLDDVPPLEELLQAAAWAQSLLAPVRNPAAFAAKVGKRLRSEVGAADLEAWRCWRAAKSVTVAGPSGGDPKALLASAEKLRQEMERRRAASHA